MLAEIDRIAIEHDVDFVIVAGDIFDRVDLTNQDRQILSNWLAATPKPVVMISGNHDARSPKIGDTCLSYLSVLPLERHLIHDGDPELIKWQGANLILVPWHGWSNHEFYPIVSALLDRVEDDDPIIVVAHEAFAGGVVDSGMEITKPGQPKIPDFPNIYWALGDLHLFQSMGNGAYYCGSPHQIDFGERLGKGCLVVKDKEVEFIPVASTALTTLTEVPEIWPPFCRYMPADHVEIIVPAGVEYVAPTGLMQSTAIKSEFRGALEGLEVSLRKTTLNSQHYDHAIVMAKEFLALVES
jgi:DNA repair exonuclease SbcCD nuclease subunit